MGEKHRNKIERHLPEIGTTLVAHYKRKQYTAKIVKKSDFPEKKAVYFNEVRYKSMTAAAIDVTCYSTNGWSFWKVT